MMFRIPRDPPSGRAYVDLTSALVRGLGEERLVERGVVLDLVDRHREVLRRRRGDQFVRDFDAVHLALI